MKKAEEVAAPAAEKVVDEENRSEEFKEMMTRKKTKSGLYFTNIPRDIRVSEFKTVLRDRNVKLVFVKWKAFKQAAIVFFEDELDVVTKNLEGLTLQEEKILFEEMKPRADGAEREREKRPPRAKKSVDEKEAPAEGGRRREKVTRGEAEGDKVGPTGRKRINRKDQRMKKREDFGGKFGIFVGKIPKGVTREDLGQEFAKLNVPLPDYVDWVVKKGHAFAFWREEDASLSLEVFSGITVGGVALQVELYDTNRIRAKDERRKEHEEKSPARKDDEDVVAKKSPPRKPTKSVSDKEVDGKESQTKPSDVKVAKAPKKDDEIKPKPTTPKKTDPVKAKESHDEKSPKVKSADEGSKSPAKSASGTKKAPETPTKTKSPKTNGTPTKSPAKSVATPTKSPTPSKAPAKSVAEPEKENCSIS